MHRGGARSTETSHELSRHNDIHGDMARSTDTTVKQAHTHHLDIYRDIALLLKSLGTYFILRLRSGGGE